MEELIKEALEKSDDFKQRMNYWINIRKKQPDIKWIIDKLANVLGEKRIITFLKEIQK